MEVTVESMKDEQVGNYNIARKKSTVKEDGEIVWKGIISDAGAGSYKDFKKGDVLKVEKGPNFSRNSEVADHFGLDIVEFILGTECFEG